MSGRRIDTVRRVREIQERVARAEVGAKQAVLAERRHVSDARWRELAARSHPSGQVDAVNFQSARVMLQAGVTVARRADAQVDSAHADVSIALEDWRVTARRLDGIDRLAARLADHERQEAERLAQAELDDQVSARHRTGRWSAS